MKRLLVFFIFVILLSGCDKSDSTNNNPTGGGDTDSYWIEFSPIVSLDRQEVYLVVWDTITNVHSGVYKASVSNPIREKIADVDSALSGVLFGDFVYYIGIDGNVYISYMYTDSATLSPTDFSRYSLVVLNDSLIVGNFGSDITLCNVNSSSFSFIGQGLHPTLYNKDTLAYLYGLSDYLYEIRLYEGGEALQNDTIILDTIVFPSQPRSFGIEPVYNRIVFSVSGPDGYDIYTLNPLGSVYTKVASSRFSYVAIINANMILFTGDDGRLYQSHMDGSAVYPFWGALE